MSGTTAPRTDNILPPPPRMSGNLQQDIVVLHTYVSDMYRVLALEESLVRAPVYAVASLPAGDQGRVAFALDGRKAGESAGAGSGVLVFHDGQNWIACDSGTPVAA